MNILNDVTSGLNENSSKYKKRLKSGEIKEYCRQNLTLNFANEAAKLDFTSSLEKAREILRPATTDKVLLIGLKCILEDSRVEQNESTSTFNSEVNDFSSNIYDRTLNTESNQNVEEEEGLNSMPKAYIFDEKALIMHTEEFSKHSSLCRSELSFKGSRNVSGFVKEIKYECKEGHSKKILSSSRLGEFYTLNCLFFVAFACSGMLKVQFEKFTRFANLGVYNSDTFKKLIIAFGAIVSLLKLESINEAMHNETSEENGEKKISMETDARHACRKNSIHTDVVALGSKTHKVVSVVHVTKTDEPSSQKHELYGTKKIYDQLTLQGLVVTDHAHDRNTSVNKYIKEKNGPTSTNDRWHAVKAIAKGLRELGKGAHKWNGIKWHPQLTDKESVVKNHMYWSIANCEKDPKKLRDNIDKCILHLQGRHELCVAESPCKEKDYVLSVDVISDPKAAEMLANYLHSTTLYKFPADYANSKDTYHVESYNNTSLIYLDKRIHYGDFIYEMRQDLIVLDWNEHVSRGYTSVWDRERVKHANRVRGKKSYKKKSYNFVGKIWELLSYRNNENDKESDISISQLTEFDSDNDDE